MHRRTRWQRAVAWIWKNPILVGILALGILVRCIQFGDIPPGLNQDEAATGYDAWSVLHYGIDRHGMRFPVMFISWGSGMYALSGYLAWPFMLLFGLSEFSIRLPHLTLGILSLIVAYTLMLKISDKTTALLAVFLLAINPWHIMISRWGLDSNVLPAFFLFAVYFFVVAVQKTNFLFSAMALLSLCLYFYGTAYVVVPLFGALALFLLWKNWRMPFQTIVASTGMAIIIGLPIMLYVLVNQYEWNSIDLPFLSIPRLTGPARFHTVPTIFSSQWIPSIWENMSIFWQFLVQQNDHIWNSLPGVGLLYPIGLPLSFIGLCFAVRDVVKKRGKHPVVFIIAWLGSAVVLALLQPVNTNRINIIFLPLILLMAYGLRLITSKHRVLLQGAIMTFSLFFAVFISAYFVQYPKKASGDFFEGIGPAVMAASSATDGPICVTSSANMPYIFVLFYQQIHPREFIDTVVYENPGAEFQSVRSFGRYTFGLDHCKGSYGAYVIHRTERQRFETGSFRRIDFEQYSAVILRAR